MQDVRLENTQPVEAHNIALKLLICHLCQWIMKAKDLHQCFNGQKSSASSLMQTVLRCKCSTNLSHGSHLQILFHTKRGKKSNSYRISTKEEAAPCISSVRCSLSIQVFGGITSWKICGWCLTGARWMVSHAVPPLSFPRWHPSDFPHPLFFPFSFLSRFPDPGLKMKRKSYCLITTAVTSIKCYLKVNGLHMLKTLELLTDHCKVSRIFNNLHVMHNPAIFGAEQTVSPGSLCQGSQQKPLLHSSLTWQNRQKVLNTEPRGTARAQPKSRISPRWSGGLGWLGGSLCSRGSERSLTLF